MSLSKNTEHLRIPYQDIKEATKNFTTLIGRGGYGPVYSGRLSLSGELTSVAVKKLDTRSRQGGKEFLTEIQLLSRYKHQNLVSLVGFCEERNAKFLVYVFAGHGSLDGYLKPKKATCPLTWKQRISICVDAARGLDHLHNHVGQNERVIHRDIKSANILLDDNWKAMIADFGLSKIGRANESVTYVITNASGTPGYIDPVYFRTWVLTKESDVYSFGVVLLELLCGRRCLVDVNNVNATERFLPQLAQRYYDEKKLNRIIDAGLKNYMNSDSMKAYSEIAFQCLQDERERRPSMGFVLHKLEEALKLLEIEEGPELLELEEELGLKKLVKTLQMQQFDEECWMDSLEEAMGLHKLVETLQRQELEETMGLNKLVETLQRQEFKEAMKLQEAWELKKLVEMFCSEIGESRVDNEVIKAIHDKRDAPLIYTMGDDVYKSHLSDGILVDRGNVWLSIDGDGKTQEMISSIRLMPVYSYCEILPAPESRFSKIVKVSLPRQELQVKIRTQFLSSGVTYAAYVICKPADFPSWYNCEQYELSYTLNDSTKSYVSHPSKMEDRVWWKFELFQTITFKRGVDFVVTFHKLTDYPLSSSDLLFEGIQFLPIQKFEDDDDDVIEKSEVNNLSTSNIEWDSALPSDYKQFIYYSNKKMMKKPQEDVIYPTKEEAYSILSKGILIKVNHEISMWFWITKSNGKKCFMLQPSRLSYDKTWAMAMFEQTTFMESRIGKVLHIPPKGYGYMRFVVPFGFLSRNTTYGQYLVYKTPHARSSTNTAEVIEMYIRNGGTLTSDVYMYPNIPQSPVIGPDGLCVSLNPINKSNTILFPRKRKDGWLEVNLGNLSDMEWLLTKKEGWYDDWGMDDSLRKRTLKSWFLDKFSRKLFTSDPPFSSYIRIQMWPIITGLYRDIMPEIIVQGIEFRPV